MNNEELKAVVEGQGKGYTATEILDTLDALYAGKIKALEDSERLALDEVGKLQTRIAQLEAQLREKDHTINFAAAKLAGQREEIAQLRSVCAEVLNEIRAYQGESEFEEGDPIKHMCDLLKMAIGDNEISGVVGSTRKDEQGQTIPLSNSHARITQLEAQLRDKDKAATQLISAIRRGVDQEELGEAIQACEQALHQPRKP